MASRPPKCPPSHVIRDDLSVLNKESGFYANHEPVADDWYNDTAYGNHPDFDLLGDPANVGILRNDIALGGTLLSNDTGAGKRRAELRSRLQLPPERPNAEPAQGVAFCFVGARATPANSAATRTALTANSGRASRCSNGR